MAVINTLESKFNDLYVNVSGDTMSGVLQIKNELRLRTPSGAATDRTAGLKPRVGASRFMIYNASTAAAAYGLIVHPGAVAGNTDYNCTFNLWTKDADTQTDYYVGVNQLYSNGLYYIGTTKAGAYSAGGPLNFAANGVTALACFITGTTETKDLLPESDSAFDLGSPSGPKYYRYGYIDRVYLDPDTYIERNVATSKYELYVDGTKVWDSNTTTIQHHQDTVLTAGKKLLFSPT